MSDFVVIRNGRETFHDEPALRRLAAGGLLGAGDLVYHPLLGRWLYAREVEEVRRELEQAARLGQPPVVVAAEVGQANPQALFGFLFGLLGMLPVIGLVACLLGLFFSARGLRAAEISGHGQALAVAGLVLSVLFLIPAAACGAILVAAS